MKPFFTLAAFTGLFQTAYSLRPGVYTIAPAQDTSSILEDKGSGQPLGIIPSPRSTYGLWTFATTDDRYFTIQSQSGDYIVCETTGDKICSSGEKPQSFEVGGPVGDNDYFLVEQTSGLFLRLLSRAPSDPTLQLGSDDDYAKFKLQYE